MDAAAAAAEIAYRVPLAAAADLVHHEARLLDRQRLDEWAELFTDDAAYWVLGRDPGTVPGPSGANGDGDGDSDSEPSACRLVTDVHPLDEELVWDGAPACHLVVASTFSLAWLTDDGEQRVLHGWANHGLRRGEDRRLRIAAKKVVLLDRAKSQENRPFPL
jgi:hypothetical protein